MTGSTNAIEISGLNVSYRKKVALTEVDLTVPPQIVMGLIGPNGAGKSTLLKAILDLIPRQTGEVKIFGKPFSENRRKVAYVPQKSTIDWDFPTTVFDLVLMGTYGQLGWLRRPGKKEHATATEAMERMGIQDLADRPIGELSGGQQQRAFLARAFAQNAPILFLDEPFVGVDMLTEQAIVQLLHELRDTGKTILVVQHDLTTVGHYLDHVTLINKTIVAAGPTGEVFTRDLVQETYGSGIQRIAFADS